MPVPSYRVPVIVARGTIAALTAGLASLEEGEICYATDEDAIYVVEGGALVEAVGTGTGNLQDVVDDTTPQLGGDLDVNTFEVISTAAGNIVFAPDTTGVVEIKGNSGNDAAIQLNCETNTHGIKLKSPPHSAAASYTLVFPGDTGTTGQALTTDGSGVLSWATPSTVGSIDDLSDVDTTTVAPTDGQALVWDNAASNWAPGTVAAATGGGGASTSARLTETQTAASGIATFSGVGHSGLLVSVASSLDAWIVLYDSAASRTADNGRAYNTDPGTGSGVLAEFYITAGNTALATPGTSYFNNDTSVTEAVYAAVRDQAGANINSAVTITAYGNQTAFVNVRSTVTHTTASLADGAAANATFNSTGKSGQFIKLATDRAAWITLYNTTAARTADASRLETVDPSSGSGVLLEVVTTGSETIQITPVSGYYNDESTPLSELYAKIVNKSGSASTVTVDVSLVPFEL